MRGKEATVFCKKGATSYKIEMSAAVVGLFDVFTIAEKASSWTESPIAVKWNPPFSYLSLTNSYVAISSSYMNGKIAWMP